MILELVRKESFGTQGGLTRRLKGLGFKVDQGTVSRDIKELGLVKVNDNYKPVDQIETGIKVSNKAMAKRLIKKIACSGNLMIIRTDPGSANTVASCIDKIDIPEILGTVAGDDTILAVLKQGVKPAKIERKILG
jgi:transcriptional regulator of arginine metabolism